MRIEHQSTPRWLSVPENSHVSARIATRAEGLSIALTSIAAPKMLRIQESTLAPTFWSLTPEPLELREQFVAKMEAARATMGRRFMAKLIEDLGSRGIASVLSEGAATHLPVLRVAFADVGMATRLWSTILEPRVNLSAHLLKTADGTDWLSTDFYYYGAESSGETVWSIPADMKHRFHSIEDMLKRPEDVIAAYDGAIQTLSMRVAGKVLERVRRLS